MSTFDQMSLRHAPDFAISVSISTFRWLNPQVHAEAHRLVYQKYRRLSPSKQDFNCFTKFCDAWKSKKTIPNERRN